MNLVGFINLVVFAGAYLLFAGEMSADEIGAAVILAVLATIFSAVLRRCAKRQFRLRGVKWHRVLGAPLLALLPDAARVGRMLLRAILRGPAAAEGAWMWQEFRHGNDGEDDTARRALVTIAASLAPNAYVLQLPDERDALLLHRLAEHAASPDREWPL